MPVDVVMQVQTECASLPTETDFVRWLSETLQDNTACLEVVVRIVDEAESADLNQTYRSKQGPTNVLSFPFDAPAEVENNLLGDLVICAPVIEREALQQGKKVEAHWAHMAVHGGLHLQGYEHQTDAQAEEMESLETEILTGMGYAAPYQLDKTS